MKEKGLKGLAYFGKKTVDQKHVSKNAHGLCRGQKENRPVWG